MNDNGYMKQYLTIMHPRTLYTIIYTKSEFNKNITFQLINSFKYICMFLSTYYINIFYQSNETFLKIVTV
jgi:hypothetical protein